MTEEKNCKNCAHDGKGFGEMPCVKCWTARYFHFPYWERKKKK